MWLSLTDQIDNLPISPALNIFRMDTSKHDSQNHRKRTVQNYWIPMIIQNDVENRS